MQPRAFYDWLRRRRYVVDTIIVVMLALFAWLLRGIQSGSAEMMLSVGLLGPLIWRRRFPMVVFAVATVACTAQLFLLDHPILANIGFLFALYAVSAYTSRRWVRLGALGIGFAGAVLAITDWDNAGPGAAIPIFILAALVGFAWTLGDLLRTRRAYVAELEERARRLEVERDQQAQIARAAERARIAREMHDVVAHSLSVVVAQADGGAYAAKDDPEAPRRALATIADTGRQALTEMRRLLGVLRSGDERAALIPQPGVAEVTDLVEQVRLSGLPVTCHIEEGAHALSSGAQLAAYRVVQEALTNIIKHAGPRACARVRITYADGAVRVEVTDDGRGAAARNDGRGQGITGMRERVALYSGSLVAGPRPGGGFRVTATIPANASNVEGVAA